jgi:hypothetical protein
VRRGWEIGIGNRDWSRGRGLSVPRGRGEICNYFNEHVLGGVKYGIIKNYRGYSESIEPES